MKRNVNGADVLEEVFVFLFECDFEIEIDYIPV